MRKNDELAFQDFIRKLGIYDCEIPLKISKRNRIAIMKKTSDFGRIAYIHV
jgi:hypothetical protein